MKRIMQILLIIVLPVVSWGGYDLIFVNVSSQENFILPFDENGMVDIQPNEFIESPVDYDADGNPTAKKEKIPLGLSFKINKADRDDGGVEFEYSVKYTELSLLQYIKSKNRLIQRQNTESIFGTGTLQLNEKYTVSKRDNIHRTNLKTGGTECFPGNKVYILYTFKVVENNFHPSG